MRLTDYTDYALRVLIYLGSHAERTVRTDEIGEAFGVSTSHLVKVVHNLARRGYVEAKRGRGGGLRLGKEPEDISIGEVIAEFEPNFEIVECFGTGNTCPIAPVCGLTPILEEASEAFHEVLGRYTLADVLRGKRKAKYRRHLAP